MSCCAVCESLASHGSHSPGLFAQLGQLVPLLETFTVEEEKQMERMLQRLDVLVKVNAHKLQRLITVHKYTHSSNCICCCKEQALIVKTIVVSTQWHVYWVNVRLMDCT